MKDRNDASLAAAEFALGLEALIASLDTVDAVGTVGSWEVEPNAVNSVPRVVKLGVDVRDVDGERLKRSVEGVKRLAEEIGIRRGVEWGVRVVNEDLPATSSRVVVGAVEDAVEALGLGGKSMRMVSRAYHDALFMARVSEMGMIFIPCEGGKSHRVDEFATSEDIVAGVQVLAQTMARLGGLFEDAGRHAGGNSRGDEGVVAGGIVHGEL